MALVFGASPGARGGLGLAAIYWSGRPPASLIMATRLGTADEALGRLVGTVGEWGELSAVAVAAPLTWSGGPRGRRAVDAALRKRLPSWAPRTWVRPPLAMPSAVVLQGAALTWGLANEIREGLLPHHTVIEAHPRLALARVFADRRDSVLGSLAAKDSPEMHVGALVTALAEAGVLRLEAEAPRTSIELEAVVAALAALGVAVPDAGLVTQELSGGEVRPLGKRPVVLLEALP
jgi:hypothetical protein